MQGITLPYFDFEINLIILPDFTQFPTALKPILRFLACFIYKPTPQ